MAERAGYGEEAKYYCGDCQSNHTECGSAEELLEASLAILEEHPKTALSNLAGNLLIGVSFEGEDNPREGHYPCSSREVFCSGHCRLSLLLGNAAPARPIGTSQRERGPSSVSLLSSGVFGWELRGWQIFLPLC
jgi:hypothetical protein